MLRVPLVLWSMINAQQIYRMGGNSYSNQVGESQQSRNCKKIFYKNGTRKSDSLLYVHKAMVCSSIYAYEHKISSFYNRFLNSLKYYKQKHENQTSLRLESYRFDNVGIMQDFGNLPSPIS